MSSKLFQVLNQITDRQGPRLCLHIPTRCASPSQSSSKFNIVPMVMGTLTGKMGCTPILPIKKIKGATQR